MPNKIETSNPRPHADMYTPPPQCHKPTPHTKRTAILMTLLRLTCICHTHEHLPLQSSSILFLKVSWAFSSLKNKARVNAFLYMIPTCMLPLVAYTLPLTYFNVLGVGFGAKVKHFSEKTLHAFIKKSLKRYFLIYIISKSMFFGEDSIMFRWRFCRFYVGKVLLLLLLFTGRSSILFLMANLKFYCLQYLATSKP